MNDRGEKIVSLAREMLRSNLNDEPSASSTPPKTGSSLRAFMLATLLAAVGSAFATHAIDSVRRPINRYERVELDALIYYATRYASQNEENLRRAMLDAVSHSSMEDLTAVDYEKARSYLLTQIR